MNAVPIGRRAYLNALRAYFSADLAFYAAEAALARAEAERNECYAAHTALLTAVREQVEKLTPGCGHKLGALLDAWPQVHAISDRLIDAYKSLSQARDQRRRAMRKLERAERLISLADVAALGTQREAMWAQHRARLHLIDDQRRCGEEPSESDPGDEQPLIHVHRPQTMRAAA